ncbi:DUF624 domain-containing protein [Deinococcus navajonensis]|uniref:DUF624 domain-containing protein n=1 Tax=Deinococcus navajonensis TaxID=309884 RepID=A0ABV8XNW4_9DEIO
MSRLPRAYRDGALLTWRHLPTLAWLNLIWIALSWTVLLAGPATLAAYALIAALREDIEPDLRRYPALLRQNLLPGVLWLLSSATFAFVVYSNLVYWRRLLGPFGDSVVSLLAVYLTWLYVALQPYLLEGLSVERRPFLQAWTPAFLALARSPLSAHLYVVVPAFLLVVSFFTRTFALVVLVSVALAFAATQVRPLVERAEPPEPSADLPEDPSPA